MHRVLVLFSTGEGQTAKIADRMADVMRQSGCDVKVCDAARFAPEMALEDFDGIIVGGSIHVGRHSPQLARFVSDHHRALDSNRSAFFSVSLSAAGAADQRKDAEDCMQQFLQRSGWQPTMTAIFAGAVLYREYGFFKRWMMKQVMKRAGGETDTSKNHEYTDWAAVEEFATKFVQVLSEPTVGNNVTV